MTDCPALDRDADRLSTVEAVSQCLSQSQSHVGAVVAHVADHVAHADVDDHLDHADE